MTTIATLIPVDDQIPYIPRLVSPTALLKRRSHFKYYFFDIGVAGFLQGRRFVPGTPEYGEAFETYIAHELRACRDYTGIDALSFWRSASGFEVDFILGDHTAIEVKAKKTIGPHDLKALAALSEEKNLKRYLCVSLEPRKRTIGGIQILPYEEFLDALWEGEFK